LKSTVAAAASQLARAAFAAASEFRLATFAADVTCPLGHPLMGGGIQPAARIDDPLYARGLVLLGEGRPVVLAALDWCEIRNDAYERWREALAQAAGTSPERVLVAALHQHDAPIADLQAERILREAKAAGSICNLEFHEQAVERVARAVRESLASARRVTHLGMGQGKVEQVASNRRFVRPDGSVSYNRMSATRDAAGQEADEGVIDPWLKTLSFWDGERALAAVSCYATHPMSYYGRGGVSSDFVGMARERRDRDDRSIFQIYTSGCSGNVTAGKYNDGAPENRPVLAERMYRGMVAAWEATRRQPLSQVAFRSVPLRLSPRTTDGYAPADLQKRLETDSKPFGQCLAALGLSWHKRLQTRPVIDLPVVDFGPAKLLLLPGESYVEYQLLAQRLRPESFVMVMGYGESAPGYVPVERALRENDGNLRDWSWVAPDAEKAMTAALREALQADLPG
jgi:hypothetical protein